MDIEIWKYLTLVSTSGVIVGFIMYHRLISKFKDLSDKHTIHNNVLKDQEVDIVDLKYAVPPAKIDIAGLFILYRRLLARLDAIDAHLKINTTGTPEK